MDFDKQFNEMALEYRPIEKRDIQNSFKLIHKESTKLQEIKDLEEFIKSLNMMMSQRFHLNQINIFKTKFEERLANLVVKK